MGTAARALLHFLGLGMGVPRREQRSEFQDVPHYAPLPMPTSPVYVHGPKGSHWWHSQSEIALIPATHMLCPVSVISPCSHRGQGALTCSRCPCT